MKIQKTWPFIIDHHDVVNGKEVVFLSRMHRKGLDLKSEILGTFQVPFWKSPSYNRMIGTTFAVGAFLFALASVFMFFCLKWPELSNLTNLTFFAGSIPFTIAAGLEHFQSANMNRVDSNTPIALIGWNPRNAGWLSTFAQFVGTLAFNISTFNSIAAPSQPVLSILEIWTPNFEGSVLFLVSGYLSYIEAGNKYWSWHPRNLSWQTNFINLLGCVAFMIAAVAPSTPDENKIAWVWEYSNTYTLIGAICFFVGALLLVKESELTSPE